MNSRKSKIRAGDLLLVFLVLAAAVTSVFLVSRARAGQKGSMVIVEVNGREVRRIALGPGLAKKTFTVEGDCGESVFEVAGNRVHMVRSACRDKVCVGMGWADSAGDSIVCLPNRVVIRLEGHRSAGGVDTVIE